MSKYIKVRWTDTYLNIFFADIISRRNWLVGSDWLVEETLLQASLEWNSLSLLTVGKPVHFKQILTSPLKRACFLQISLSSALGLVSQLLTV